MLTKSVVLTIEFLAVWGVYYGYAWLSQTDLSIGVLTALLFFTDKVVGLIRTRLSGSA
ncbi:MAG: hypothetical protein AAGA78_13080 [Pseudomonadota bacterium]